MPDPQSNELGSPVLIRLPEREDLSIEFKSDKPGLPDTELVDAIICLANAKGGDLYLGVEDDGVVSGVSKQHDDPHGLAALIGNRTTPRLVVSADRIVLDGHHVIRARHTQS
jgi:ATP-dependent DNA helicase RecG